MFGHFSDDAVIRMKYRLVRMAYLVKSDHRGDKAVRKTHPALDLLPLLAYLHDRLQASISRTDHLKHPLVLRRSVEECCSCRRSYGCRPFIDERRNGLRAVHSNRTCHSPKYPTLIDVTQNSTDNDARTQSGSCFHLHMGALIAKLCESCCWPPNEYC